MKPLLAMSFAFVVGCENEVQPKTDAACADMPPAAICEHEDPSIVARCVSGICTPFDCDICPRLPCRSIACVDGTCRQTNAEDFSHCAAFPDPFASSGPLGWCSDGDCIGTVGCQSMPVCPSVECVHSICDEKKRCIGLSPLPGTGCTTSDDKPGFCFNYTCSAP
jgi:hypothetical protein